MTRSSGVRDWRTAASPAAMRMRDCTEACGAEHPCGCTLKGRQVLPEDSESGLQARTVGEKPVERLADASSKALVGLQPRAVRRAVLRSLRGCNRVWTGRTWAAPEPDDARYRARQFLDGYVGSTANIDPAVALVALHEKHRQAPRRD